MTKVVFLFYGSGAKLETAIHTEPLGEVGADRPLDVSAVPSGPEVVSRSAAPGQPHVSD